MAHGRNRLPIFRTQSLVIIKHQYVPSMLEHSAPAGQNHRGIIWRKVQDPFCAIMLLWLYSSFTLLCFHSTILSLYYVFTLLCFHSTILSLYYVFTLLFFYSTILLLYYVFTLYTMLSLYYFFTLLCFHSTIHLLCDVVRISEVSQLNFLWSYSNPSGSQNNWQKLGSLPTTGQQKIVQLWHVSCEGPWLVLDMLDEMWDAIDFYLCSQENEIQKYQRLARSWWTLTRLTSRASDAPSGACTFDPAGGGGNSCRDHTSEPCFFENNLRHEPPKRGPAQEPDG